MTFYPRWKLVDPDGDLADFHFPISPNQMDPPELSNDVNPQAHGPTFVSIFDTQTPGPGEDWMFEGVIYTLAQHDTFEDWLNHGRPVEVHDHFGRVFLVLLRSIDAPRHRSRQNPEKHKYTMHTTMLDRLS